MRKFSLILLFLICSLAAAEKWALLVGINDYQGDISPLRYCETDVAAFRQSLVEVAGFAPDKIYLMTSRMSGQKEPTNVNVIKHLSLLSGRIKPDDTFIFYFAGHGISKDGYSFLLATNSDSTTVDTLKISAVPLNQVSQILSRIKAKQLLTIIDACRNDPESGRGEKDNLLTDTFSRGFKIKRISDTSGEPKISATLYACNIGERAYEWQEKEHGVFSYYLLEGLRGKAVNSQGELVVTDLADYTQKKVVAWSEEYKGRKQTPWLDQSGGAKLILAEGVNQSEKPAQAGETIMVDAEAEMWEMVKDTTDLSDMEEFLALFPSGKLAGVAKFKLKKLEKNTNRPVTSTSRPNQQSTNKMTSKDSTEMVLIPAGSLEMGEKPRPLLGIMMEEGESGGVKITKVVSGSAADQAGIVANDWIISIDAEKAESVQHIQRVIKGKNVGQRIRIEVFRSGAFKIVNAVLNGTKSTLRFVKLDAFYMDANEMTVGQFKKFLESSGYKPDAPINWNEVYEYSPTDKHPMVYVSWHDAKAYAEWAGKRLPSEAEWEYAARGGLVGKEYVWGDEEPNGSQCNHADKNADATLRQLDESYNWADMKSDDGYARCAPVSGYPPNGYGLYDMAGNVWEWCQDWYDSDQQYRVLRGGGWSGNAVRLRVANRFNDSPNYRNGDLGFRCVSGSN